MTLTTITLVPYFQVEELDSSPILSDHKPVRCILKDEDQGSIYGSDSVSQS